MEDAHAWRSQTLRILLPNQGANTLEGEKSMRITTEGKIEKVAEKHASNFLEGSARYLFNPERNNEETNQKVRAIYKEAAMLSYRLWTQKTTLRCFSLQDLQEIEKLVFDADDEYLKPNPLVGYYKHEDQLKGKPITLIVHPLILVFGTSEGKDYDSERIWASGEVWLNSKLE